MCIIFVLTILMIIMRRSSKRSRAENLKKVFQVLLHGRLTVIVLYALAHSIILITVRNI
jgi:hypothetical protein